MKFKLFWILIILLSLTARAQSQSTLTGTVYDSSTKTALPDVLVRSNRSKHAAVTGKRGHFKISGTSGDLLIFTAYGYTPDTLYIVDQTPINIQLSSDVQSLGEVRVTAKLSAPAFDPQKEYPEVYEKSKFALSPSRLLGKDAREARRLKRYFDNEVKQRKIDSIFNINLVSNIVPLSGRELRNFMAIYRPRLSFLNKSSRESLALYVNDCYKRFMTLPPDKRKLPGLK